MNHTKPKRHARHNPAGQATESFLDRQNDDLSKNQPVDRPTKVGLYTRCYKCQQLTCRKRYLARRFVSIKKSKRKRGGRMRMYQHCQAPPELLLRRPKAIRSP